MHDGKNFLLDHINPFCHTSEFKIWEAIQDCWNQAWKNTGTSTLISAITKEPKLVFIFVFIKTYNCWSFSRLKVWNFKTKTFDRLYVLIWISHYFKQCFWMLTAGDQLCFSITGPYFYICKEKPAQTGSWNFEYVITFKLISV